MARAWGVFGSAHRSGVQRASRIHRGRPLRAQAIPARAARRGGIRQIPCLSSGMALRLGGWGGQSLAGETLAEAGERPLSSARAAAPVAREDCKETGVGGTTP